MSKTLKTQLAVLGAGPGGYPAAFLAADLGMDVVLIDRDPNPGGVCLYRGCIPSKALLHAADIVQGAREAETIGIRFSAPQIDLGRVRDWKQSVVDKLTGGLGQLTAARGVQFLHGNGHFTGPRTLAVDRDGDGTTEVEFDHAIVATGSVPAMPRLVPESPRVLDSTGALAFQDLPDSLLVMGGGYIGLELGQVYARMGVRVSVVEMQASLLPAMEPDLVKVLAARVGEEFEEVMLATRVVAMNDVGDAVEVEFATSNDARSTRRFGKVLVAVGRRPTTEGLGLAEVGVEVRDDGFLRVDAHFRTSNERILAVGDIVGGALLAHKATHEGRAAVQSLQDGKPAYEPRAIPAIVFTDPEIAWCGLTESEARRKGLNVRTGRFDWQASGRAATLGRGEGLTTVVAEYETGRVLGVGLVGAGAGELIGEAVLAIEMGAVAEDLALTVHPHPSLSETLMEAAESVLGHPTHSLRRL